jgi:hypothetical protein
MPILFVLGAVGVLAAVLMMNRSAGGAVGADGQPLAPTVSVDLNPSGAGHDKATGGKLSAADVVTVAAAGTDVGNKRGLGIVSAGASIGTAIAPGLGTALGAIGGALAVGIVEMFDPTKTVLDTDFSKFGMPYADRATEVTRDTVKLYVPGPDGMPVSIEWQRSYLLAKLAMGDAACLQSMIDGRMFAWRPRESTPVNDLIYETYPDLAKFHFAGPWDKGFVDTTAEYGGLAGVLTPADVKRHINNVRTLWYTRHVFIEDRAWLTALFDKNPLLRYVGPEKGEGLHNSLGPLMLYSYVGVSKSNLTWLTKSKLADRFFQAKTIPTNAGAVARGILSMGLSTTSTAISNNLNKSDLEIANRFRDKAKAFKGEIKPCGTGYWGAWQWTGGGTFRVWFSAAKPAGEPRLPVSVVVDASLADFADLFGGEAGAQAALQAGKVAPGPSQSNAVMARWHHVLANGSKSRGAGKALIAAVPPTLTMSGRTTTGATVATRLR